MTARSGVLLRFAYLLCGDRHLAEDLVQEVLIKAHRRWRAIEANNPDAYLKRALVHTHVSWLRRRATSEIALERLPEAPTGHGFDDSQASRDELWALLATLPRAQRAVLVLRYFEDLDDRRIAEVIGVTPSTVRVHAHRALASLRETLAQRAEEAPAGVGLLDNVRRGAARAAARRRAAVAGGIAAVVAALLLLVPFLRPRPSPPPVVPTPSAPSTSSSPSTPTTTATTNLDLVPTPVSAPTFPYTLTYLPPGMEPAFVAINYQKVAVTYGADRPEDDPPLRIYMQDERGFGDPGENEVRSTVTVRGAPATQWVVAGTSAELEWEWDGHWFYAFGRGAVDAAELVRVAEGMTPGITTSTPSPIDAIASVLLPPGYIYSQWHRDQLCAQPPSARGAEVCITISSADPAPGSHVEELVIGGQPAYTYRANGNGSGLVVQRTDGRFVNITWTLFEGAGLATEDLLTLYHGIVFD